MFLHNKYRIWHDAIIARAKLRELIGYKERHHIVPRSLGGLNGKDNLVDLTFREHFLIHWLLTKITEGNAQIKMQHAMAHMSCARSGRNVASWQYEVGRLLNRRAGRKRVFDAEYRKKLSLALKGKKKPPGHGAAISRYYQINPKTISEEQRKKVSLVHKGKTISQAQRDHNSAFHRARERSEAEKIHIRSIVQLGADSRTPETFKKIAATKRSRPPTEGEKAARAKGVLAMRMHWACKRVKQQMVEDLERWGISYA